MKKIVIWVGIFLFILGACQYVGDWDNFLLSGSGYKLNNSDYSHVYLTRVESSDFIIDEQVVDFKIKKGYLMVLRMIATSIDCYDEKNQPTILTHNSNQKEFWIIDTENKIEMGPFNEAEFFKKTNELNLPLIKLNIPKKYRSNNEAFTEQTSKCFRID